MTRYTCGYCKKPWDSIDMCTSPNFIEGCFNCGHESALLYSINGKNLPFCPKHGREYENQTKNEMITRIRESFEDWE